MKVDLQRSTRLTRRLGDQTKRRLRSHRPNPGVAQSESRKMPRGLRTSQAERQLAE